MKHQHTILTRGRSAVLSCLQSFRLPRTAEILRHRFVLFVLVAIFATLAAAGPAHHALAAEAETISEPAFRVSTDFRPSLTLIDWAVIAAYGIGMLAIGWFYWRREQSREDYLLGGRSMRPLAVGLSLFATLFSTISYLAWPGEMIKNGPMVLSMVVAYPFVAIVAGWFMIPFIMKLKITSAYELLETRLGLSVRMLGSSLFLLLRILWMATIIYATVEAVLMPIVGISPEWVPWVSAGLGLITLIYTAMGGLKAVVVTDVLQGLILFFGAIVALVLITYYMGGVTAWWPTGWAAHWTKPVFFDPNVRLSFLSASLATFTWYIATAGSDQMAIQRYLATRDARSARRVLNTSLIANTAVFALLGSLGLALLAYFSKHPELLVPGESLVGSADQLFTRFILVGLPPGLSGLVVAGLLAAAMSSLSAGINSCCSVITVDYIDRFGWRNPDAAGARRAILEQVISVAVGVVVLVLSSYVSQVPGNLLDKAYKVVNLLSTPLFGLFFMAMFIPWSTPLGTWAGAVVGVATCVAINFWEELTGTKGISFFWAMPVSILAQIAVGVAMSAIPFGIRARDRDFEK